MLYNTSYVIKYNTLSYKTHFLLYSTRYVMLYNTRYITHVMLYNVMLYYITHVALYNTICYVI